MARMEPENNIEVILDGFSKSNSARRFIVIGNTSNKYGTFIRDKFRNDERIVFLGAIFDEFKVRSLTAYCSLYFHGHTVGGTNPSLLDAMAAKAPLAAHANPFNRSVLEENALFFSGDEDICKLINENRFADTHFIQNNYNKVAGDFAWDVITNQYEQYFLECYQNQQSYYPLNNEKAILYRGQYSE